MEINLNNLGREQIILFNQIYLNEKKTFINFLSNFYKKKNNLNLISPYLGRDNAVSILYLEICNFKLVKKIINKDKNKFYKIISSNYFQYLFFKKNLKNDKIKIVYNKKKAEMLKFYAKVVFRIFYIIIFSFFELLNGSKERIKKIKKLKNIVLVDTAFIESMFVNDDFKDRFYGNLLDYSNNKNKIVFSPVNLMFEKTSKSIQIIEKKKIDTLFRFDVLNLFDYLYALKFVIFYNKPKNIYKYNSIDVSHLIHHDYINGIANFNFFYGVLNFLFFKKLKNYNLNIKSIIHWGENQPADKGFIFGAKTFFKDISLKTYIGYFSNYNACFYMQPTYDEYKSNFFPEKVYIQNTSLSKGLKKFCNKLKISVAPNLRFQHIFKKYKHKYEKKNILNVLILLPILKTEGVKILNQIIKIKDLKEMRMYNFLIKFHPNYTKPFIQRYSSFSNKKFKIVYNNFYKIIKKSDIVISNQSSTCVESILSGVPVICIANSHNLVDNPLHGLVSKKLYLDSFNSADLKDKLLKMKKIKEKNLIYEFNKSSKKLKENTGSIERKEIIKFINN